MTEIFKVKTGKAPELMKGVFKLTDVPYNLRNQSKCKSSIPCTEGMALKQHLLEVQNYIWTKFPQK